VATVSKHTYNAVCRRVGDWWAVDVPEVRGVHTQARRLDQVEAMTRDAIASLKNVAPSSFDVKVEPLLDGAVEKTVIAATEASERARVAAEEAGRLQRSAATTLLKKYGLTVRDAGALLHVSPQRVSQLAKVKTSSTTSRRKVAKASQGRNGSRQR
jgi:predicted RNase H-like HicB family nuclease